MNLPLRVRSTTKPQRLVMLLDAHGAEIARLPSRGINDQDDRIETAVQIAAAVNCERTETVQVERL